MIILVLITQILLIINLSNSSNVKISRLFGQTSEEQCVDFGCTVVKSENYYTSCGKSTICSNCQFEPFKPIKQICHSWKSLKFDQLELANGSIHTNNRLSGQVFENLSADWDSKDPIDITKCQIENFNYNKAYNAFSTGHYTSLYSTLTFHVTLITNYSKKKKKKIPSIEFQLDLDETLEELNARNSNFYIKREKSLCPISHLLTPLKISQKKSKGDVTIINRSFSIPLDKSGVYRPYEFRLKVRCKEKSNCDMSIYKFCLRITCSRMPEFQIAEYKIVQELIKNPPAGVEVNQDQNEINQEEIESNDKEDKEELGNKDDISETRGDSHIETSTNTNTQKKKIIIMNKNNLSTNSIVNFNRNRTFAEEILNKKTTIVGAAIFILLILIGCFMFLIKKS